MYIDSSANKSSSFRFFLLVFILALPFWLIGTGFEEALPLPMKLPVSALSFICPMIAALILVYKENKRDGIINLFKRVLDYKKIRPKVWYVPIILLMPIIYFLSYEIICLFGYPLPEPHIRFIIIPVLFAGFFFSALCEEIGWTGYAADPLQKNWTALETGIILGIVWGIFHTIPDIQAQRSIYWIFWQRGVYSIALRILIVWIYNNTGRSLFATILFHDMDNVSWALFPNNGSHYDPSITGILTVIITLIIVFLWGSKTLAGYRYA
jgi:uncharacterized protein